MDEEREDAEREPREELDPRFTLANERTFLAWNRTALALVGGGLLVAHLLDVEIVAARIALALLLIGLGAVAALLSYRRWEETERAMRRGDPLPRDPLPRLLGWAVGVIAVLAAVIVILDQVLT